jgi:beta-phosphoglucomutase
MTIKGILFDYDGVLAETMEDLFLAWKKAFLDYGIEIKKGDYFPLEGTKVVEVARIISNKYDICPEPFDVVKKKDEYYLSNHKFSFYPGVEDFIDVLIKNNIKIAIVSASQKHKLDKTVPKDFLKKFDEIICGDDYKNGKPNAEPYLTAANKLGLKPEECIVVENAPLGIKSAKNAGIFCIGIDSTLPKEYLREADIIIDKFEDLKNLDIIKNILIMT